MPKYFGGTHVTQMIHGKKIAKRYRGAKLYFEELIPTGYTMWSGTTGFLNSSNNDDRPAGVLINSNLTLSKPLSKLDKGITINASSLVNVDSGRFSSIPTDGFSRAVNISKADILSGNFVLYQNPPASTDMANNADVNKIYVKSLNDTTLQFESSGMANSGGGAKIQDTVIAYLAGQVALKIDSITAY